MANPYTVYALQDPRDGAVRYVGFTADAQRRLGRHIRDARSSKGHNHRVNWIKALLKEGLEPSMVVVETGIGDNWADKERGWIRFFLDLGCRLTNGTDGGDGVPGCKFSAKHCANISAAKKGHAVSTEARAKISAFWKGRKLPPHTVEYRHRMSIAKTGRKHSPEARAKMSTSHTGMKQSAETVEKRVATFRGTKRSPEIRARMSEAARRRKSPPLSAEHRARISASMRKFKLAQRAR